MKPFLLLCLIALSFCHGAPIVSSSPSPFWWVSTPPSFPPTRTNSTTTATISTAQTFSPSRTPSPYWWIGTSAQFSQTTTTATVTQSKTLSPSNTRSRYYTESSSRSRYYSESHTRTLFYSESPFSPFPTPTSYSTIVRSDSNTPSTYWWITGNHPTNTATRTRYYSESSTRTASLSRTAASTPLAPSDTSSPTVTPTDSKSWYHSESLAYSASVSRSANSYITATRTPTKRNDNCYVHTEITPVTPGSCVLLNSCHVQDRDNVYFEYAYNNYNVSSVTSGLFYYLIPSDTITQCSQLRSRCYAICGREENPIYGSLFLGDVENRVFQFWAYNANLPSSGENHNLYVNGTSRTIYSNDALF